MTEQATTQGESADAMPPPPHNKSKASVVWRELKKAPLTAPLGLIIIITYIVVALFAPILAPYGESQIVGSEYEIWSNQFPLGTDNLGRDMVTRLIYGAGNGSGLDGQCAGDTKNQRHIGGRELSDNCPIVRPILACCTCDVNSRSGKPSRSGKKRFRRLGITCSLVAIAFSKQPPQSPLTRGLVWCHSPRVGGWLAIQDNHKISVV